MQVDWQFESSQYGPAWGVRYKPSIGVHQAVQFQQVALSRCVRKHSHPHVAVQIGMGGYPPRILGPDQQGLPEFHMARRE